MSGKRTTKKRRTPTTKKILWICLVNGILWVWCSYALAFIGMLRENYAGASIAETLSSAAITEIIGVVLVYCAKSLFEKRKDFGEVGKDVSYEQSELGGDCR